MLHNLVSEWIGDDIGTTHVAEAAQWSVNGVAGVCGNGVHESTLFDVASLTKLFTATAALIAVDRGMVQLNAPISVAFPTAVNGNATLAQLLSHSSGFPPWRKFYEELPFPNTVEEADNNREQVLNFILETNSVTPPGSVGVYSDLGYILLGRWVERLFDERLDRVVQSEVLAPLGMERSRYVVKAPPIDAVRTELDDRRPHVTDQDGAVCGVVHDENCYIQGGVEGHAGLFSTATELDIFAQHMLEISTGGDGILSTRTLTHAWSREHLPPIGHHVLGWDTPSGNKTSVGRGFDRDVTVGHLGFTGTSLWIDRERKITAVLLTNRVFPTRDNDRILDFRIDFHETVIPPET